MQAEVNVLGRENNEAFKGNFLFQYLSTYLIKKVTFRTRDQNLRPHKLYYINNQILLYEKKLYLLV